MQHVDVTELVLNANSLAGALRCSAPATSLSELLACVLDWLSYGVVLVDHNVRPLFANKTAAALIGQGRLPLARKRTQHRTDPIEGVRQALASFNDGNVPATVTCRIGDPPLICTVASLARSSTQTGLASAILFLIDPDQMRTTTLSNLASFGLTRAEAAFAVEFANGHSVQKCAQRLGICPTTAKTHLKHVFEKTGASRQAELMRVILTSTPALCHGEGGRPESVQENRFPPIPSVAVRNPSSTIRPA